MTVPVLWDTRTYTIVSNDSWAIVRMLATAFAPLARANRAAGAPPRADQPLFPADRDAELEAAHAKIYAGLLNGVYRAGVGELLGNAAAAAAARADVARALDELEATLARSRYVLGPALTAVDVRLAMTLLRFDAAYLDAFALRGAARGGVLVGETADGGGPPYPALRGYTREMYARVGGAAVVDWPSFRQYYRWGPGLPRDAPLPPLEPLVASAEAPHDRAALAAA